MPELPGMELFISVRSVVVERSTSHAQSAAASERLRRHPFTAQAVPHVTLQACSCSLLWESQLERRGSSAAIAKAIV